MSVARPLWGDIEGRPNQKYWLDKNENLYLAKELSSFLYSQIDISSLSTYPDLGTTYGLLYDIFGVNEKNCLLCRGSDDAIGSIFKSRRDFTDAIICNPSFAMNSVYPLNLEYVIHMHEYKLSGTGFTISYNDLTREISSVKNSVSILASPDSPTGATHSIESIREIAESVDNTGILLVDATYALSVGMSYLVDLIQISITHPNVLMATSLSKFPGLAGCRLGFISGTDSTLEVLRSSRPMYEMGALSSNIFNLALSNWDLCLDVIETTRLCKLNLETLLVRFGAKVFQSQGNFSLFYATDAMTTALNELCTYRTFSDDSPLSGITRLTTPPLSFIEEFESRLTK